ncbi:MAG TPA: response regulator [Kofleriaceae bacterium]|nr:response regulator [Kofleriaceae bacterium]
MSDQPIRVLVLDDNELHLELVERSLSGDGFDVRLAETIADMQRIAAGFDPDIMLVDMNLPDTPRERVVTAAREAAPRAGIVICSAWEESRLRGLCKELGADGYISKSESMMAIGRRLTEMRSSGILARR